MQLISVVYHSLLLVHCRTLIRPYAALRPDLYICNSLSDLNIDIPVPTSLLFLKTFLGVSGSLAQLERSWCQAEELLIPVCVVLLSPSIVIEDAHSGV